MSDALTQDLLRDENLKLKPYRDTVGKLTIGVGRNIDDNGITEEEALFLLKNDIRRSESDLDRNASWWRGLPDDAQRGLVNMAFNIGWPRLAKFDRMLMALKFGRFNTAADEALDSQWAKQVKGRAERIADLYRKCDDTHSKAGDA